MVTKKEVKDAIEYRWRGTQVKTYLGLWAIILLVYGVALIFSVVMDGSFRDARSWGFLGTGMAVVAGLYTLAILPFALYCAYQQWEMVKNCGRYQRYRVKLDEPNTSWNYRRAVGYRVVFTPEKGGKIARYTKPLFSSQGMGTYPLSEYNNRTVDIFYDPESDRVIRVGNVQ